MSAPTRLRAAVLALLALVLTAGLLGPASPAGAAVGDRYEKVARQVTNKARANHDLVKLRRQRCVQRKAERHVRWMARNNSLEHQDLTPVMEDCKLSTAGENIAMGYSTGRQVVRAWMRSEGHRANILNKRFRLLGMAAVKDDDGRWWAAQVFGRRRR
ncbi:CAP domain-containing protein [Nocardioides bruguierae]|uniref:CAP domain-containing protein n=1 Tax=Nocardioides bruguierae TaxID=2945102 RepID=A0A9X2D708_9ACTN|nr:CAP domain-containing protein [Nocardioides bruguierae]MCM0620505.1 CAP domain-containing protein [Nocardioides bruguierae]